MNGNTLIKRSGSFDSGYNNNSQMVKIDMPSEYRDVIREGLSQSVKNNFKSIATPHSPNTVARKCQELLENYTENKTKDLNYQISYDDIKELYAILSHKNTELQNYEYVSTSDRARANILTVLDLLEKGINSNKNSQYADTQSVLNLKKDVTELLSKNTWSEVGYHVKDLTSTSLRFGAIPGSLGFILGLSAQQVGASFILGELCCGLGTVITFVFASFSSETPVETSIKKINERFVENKKDL